jgi:hypothetical protein
MTCKSAIYTTNNTNMTVTATPTAPAQVPFGSVVRRFGRHVRLEGGSIFCCDSGYFDVDCNLTITPTDAGVVTARLYQDGVAVPGAFASETAAAGDTINLSIDALVRNCGCNCNSILTLTVDASGVISNFPCVVEKL